MTDPTRRDLILFLIQEKGYTSYLEIGVDNGWTLDAIPLTDKVGVDPEPRSHATEHVTSDTYFARCDRRFDLIFIDGDHSAAQARTDLANALAILNPGGTIVLHDCLPTLPSQQVLPGDFLGAYTGDVWRVVAGLPVGADWWRIGAFDWGCGVVFPDESVQAPTPMEPGWWRYLAWRAHHPNIVDWEHLQEWISRPGSWAGSGASPAKTPVSLTAARDHSAP